MKVYELFEVSSEPKKNDFSYSNHKVYHDSLRLEAECLVDCMDLDEEITDEEYNKLVENALRDIIADLSRYGRYPVNGVPKYVAY